MSLIGLFLVSMAAVGYETALIRYFAVSKWSEYGYWVISIVMVGFALSGVARRRRPPRRSTRQPRASRTVRCRWRISEFAHAPRS